MHEVLFDPLSYTLGDHQTRKMIFQENPLHTFYNNEDFENQHKF